MVILYLLHKSEENWRKYLDKPIVQFGDAKRLRWLFLRISLCIRQIPKVISNDQYPTNSSLTFKLQSGRDASEEVNRSTVMKDTDRVREERTPPKPGG
jgi:hypothetical protein